jgi:acetyl esterase/lipase
MPYPFRVKRIIAFLMLIGFIVSWPFVHTHLEALAVLKAVAGQPVSGVLKVLAIEPVAVHDETIQTEAGPVRARFYVPTRHPDAHGLVVFHGVHHLGIDEPRLMAFAQAMAASGLNVVTPELPDIKDYRISERSIQTIGASAKWFAQRRGAPVGVMGLSFSGGLALVAAADKQYAPSMRFVFAVGSQDAMTRVADYYRTGRDPRPDGTTEILAAHEYGPLVLEYEHVEDFVPAADVEPIRAVLRAHLYEDKPAEDAAAARLTPKQYTEAKGLMDATSNATRALLQASATKHLADMRALSPDADLRRLTVPVFLLHGEGDNIIPAAETLWMASELKAETLRAALVSPMLSHLDMNKEPGAWDEWRLVHFMALVLRAAQR